MMHSLFWSSGHVIESLFYTFPLQVGFLVLGLVEYSICEAAVDFLCMLSARSQMLKILFLFGSMSIIDFSVLLNCNFGPLFSPFGGFSACILKKCGSFGPSITC